MDKRFVNREFYEQELIALHNINTHYIMKNPHFHDGFEINCAITEGVKFYIEDKEYHLMEHTVTLLSNTEMHYIEVPSSHVYERFIISFLSEYVAEFDHLGIDLLEFFIRRPKDFIHCVQLNEEQYQKFYQMAEELCSCSRNDGFAKEARKKLLLVQLLIFCNEIYSKKQSREGYQNCFNSRIRAIVQYIQAHYQEELTLEFLSREFFISKSYLITLFKRTTGMTPNEYIINQRIMKSREFLREGLPVMKVCELIGYEDESHFIRTFKGIIGVTPKQYSLKYSRISNKNIALE